ncbi:alpha/beta hydrolase [Polymorphobacter arshaanensis]|uniref:Alpha/beta hydrolase n=1 Tax=Glacieibacterium arshaanense TaxID=2511025 RepID=A0A4Y9ES11_9SPHN|nr:alpha/beta hydrolase [Polymorphobacter arshaanensis]TFU05993.1 alpha/beta hydrolase [Polymorphobacter arshaanensis]
MTSLTRQYRQIPDGEVWTLEWRDAGERAPWLHFLHATGMNAELYRPLLAPLAGEFNIVASDARGHGMTKLPADPDQLQRWTTYQDDLGALLASYGRSEPWLLAGHSMGATVTLELAARTPGLARAVLMIEPATVPFANAAAFEAERVAGTSGPSHMDAQARRRRRDWPSLAELRAAYHGRGVFKTWGDEWLDAYLAGGTRPNAEGGVSLSCDPLWEAATFRAVSATLEASLHDWHGPMALLFANEGSTVTRADVPVFMARPGRTEAYFEQAGHFLPVEHPDEVAAAIRELAARS